MTGRLRAGTAASLVLAAALAVASVLLGAGSAQALPQTVPLQATFTDLLPGDVRSTSWPLRVPQNARIESATLRQVGPGDLRWAVELCPSNGAACLRDLMPGAAVAAGDYELRVGLTVVSLDLGQTQTIEGRYTLVSTGSPPLAYTGGGPSGGLARTGAAAALPLGLAALTAAVLGLFLVVLARRRRDDGRATLSNPTTDVLETT